MDCPFGMKTKRNNRRLGNRWRLGNNRPGFTLLEMVVSLSIIVMMTVIFTANYHTTNRRTDLTMAAQTLVADLHLAQNNTLGLEKYNGAVPAGGWGIHFGLNDSKYTLFADLNAPSTAGSGTYQAPDEGQVDYGARVTQLANGITITNLKDMNGFQTSDDVTFLPPDPITTINNGTATSSVLLIVLTDNQSGQTKTVSINFLGLAEVIN